jgi:hypothetical protein
MERWPERPYLPQQLADGSSDERTLFAAPALSEGGHGSLARRRIAVGWPAPQLIVNICWLLAWPLAARAQQAERVRRIGVLVAAYAETDVLG